MKIVFLLFVLTFNVEALVKNRNVTDCKEKALGTCFEFAGRARLYNNRDVRVWKKGTNRLYEIVSQSNTAFYDLKHLSMSTEIHGNFSVCLVKPEVGSGVEHICVQSVKDMKTTSMPE